jgi:hypothetical protein
MAEKSNKYQRMMMDILGTRPVAFNPDLARTLGSVTAGLFLCQLLYWWKKGRNPDMIYKTVKEFEEETALSKTQQLNAQKICIRKGAIEVLYKGIPQKRHFKINTKIIVSLLENTTSAKSAHGKGKETRQLIGLDNDTQMSGSVPSNTESTFSENTKQRSRTAVRRGGSDATRDIKPLLDNFHQMFANTSSSSREV